MTPERVLALLEQVRRGEVDAASALDRLAWSPSERLSFATVDHHRALRQGHPEVIFGQGKTPDQIVAIAERLAERGDGVLVTRAAPEALTALRERWPAIEINELGRTAFLPPDDAPVPGADHVLIITAGTSDLPVAEEAAVTARALGLRTERLTDVGVSGIHRLLDQSDALRRASVIVVVAGMEGALPSVVGGLVSVPVIAVPTSVGYGASFGGLAALLGMLNSCASGLTVVNIDNGFGAAFAAARMLRLVSKPRA